MKNTRNNLFKLCKELRLKKNWNRNCKNVSIVQIQPKKIYAMHFMFHTPQIYAKNNFCINQ